MSDKKELNNEQLENVSGGFVGYQKGKYYVDLICTKSTDWGCLEFGPYNTEQEAKTVAENKANGLRARGYNKFEIQTKFRNLEGKWEYGVKYSY